MSDSPINKQIVIKAKFIQGYTDFSGYTIYVFENLESDYWDNKYVMCVRYPNWEGEEPQSNIIGFLQYTYIYAGTSYFNRITGKNNIYEYDHVRFDKFLPLVREEKIDNIIKLD